MQGIRPDRVVLEGTVSAATITPTSTFEELGIDSLDGIQIVFALEMEFDVSIPDDAAKSIRGIAEAAFHAASFLATGFSVVTTMTRTCVIAERLVQRYGFERSCRGIHGTDIPVLDLETCGEPTVARIEAAARQALAQDRSGAIVLGCAGMAALTAELQRRLGVPVIDGVAVAVKFAESLAALGLRTSKQGDYASPLPKPWAGAMQSLGW